MSVYASDPEADARPVTRLLLFYNIPLPLTSLWGPIWLHKKSPSSPLSWASCSVSLAVRIQETHWDLEPRCLRGHHASSHFLSGTPNFQNVGAISPSLSSVAMRSMGVLGGRQNSRWLNGSVTGGLASMEEAAKVRGCALAASNNPTLAVACAPNTFNYVMW